MDDHSTLPFLDGTGWRAVRFGSGLATMPPEGAEFSPNPLLAETAIAARTKRIRLGQAANIITWWHPVRIVEDLAFDADQAGAGRRVV